ncbi:conjugal transfer protein TraK [Vibrio ichthyoenteri ATCC 700023]|uniref:Conjugal transfer protein TraK n=1 Tax=Vibrio ichthyoenteri ATCC 700023 TaxID=870968 RepID=F9S7J0_9VIBR|nr:hypothetical protein [Vibrio ichthyoenteri]EGU31286.1 conjugal transfer protein TraK [Vibrio ichthyoenteri ATCC 700023]
MSNKVFFSLLFIVFTIIALFCGLYGGGYFFLKKVQIDTNILSYETLFIYYEAYQHDSAVKKFISIGFAIAGFVSLLPALFGFFMFISVQKKEELHGSARFATDLEIKKRGLID